MRTSDSTANIADALVRANLVLMNPAKSQPVQAGKKSYSFAPLPEILDDVRPVLQAHGLAVIQEAISLGAGVGVATRILHTSGEWVEFSPLVLPAGGDAQSAGSAITYARRYALCAALSIAAEDDDDGAKASRPRKKSPPAKRSGESAQADQDGGGADVHGEGTDALPPPNNGDWTEQLEIRYGSLGAAFVAAKARYPEAKSLVGLSQEQVEALLAQEVSA